MERNTVLAIILSTFVLMASFFIQSYRMSQQPSMPDTAIQTQPVEPEITAVPQMQPPVQAITAPPVIEEARPSLAELDANVPLQHITVSTELFTAVLTNAGGDIISFRWRDQRRRDDDADRYVELILSGANEARAFSVSFDDPARPVTSNFRVNQISDYSVEFYRDFISPSGVYGSDGVFRLIKRYDFKPNEFMFELTITLDGGFSVPGFNFAGNAYILSFGPQIGPEFIRLDGHYDYRHYNIYVNGRRRDAKINEMIDSRPAWAAISGKYFTFIALPYFAQYSLSFSEREEMGLASTSRLNIFRPAINASRISDTYRFYIGPKTQEILIDYNTGRNDFNIRDANLVEVTSTRGFWGIFSPLERVLKWLLLGIYGLVPNYGIAIILLTLLIKILFFPLTKKGSEGTLRMQALAPKIKELQEKHKGNPQKLQMEMANFYKQEGYNPLSGCLPMLLQLPIFISMFSLFNNHFDLRGAMFIPGWIPDLSLPEYIVQSDTFRLPLLGWNALRALPFIYVGSQLLYGKVTQMPGQQSNTQMKMMLYVMPLIFFFVLYNVPSGLLIYWIFSNLLTLVQQLIINKYIIKKKAAQAPPEPEPKIVPPGKKKKKKS